MMFRMGWSPPEISLRQAKHILFITLDLISWGTFCDHVRKYLAELLLHCFGNLTIGGQLTSGPWFCTDQAGQPIRQISNKSITLNVNWELHSKHFGHYLRLERSLSEN